MSLIIHSLPLSVFKLPANGLLLVPKSIKCGPQLDINNVYFLIKLFCLVINYLLIKFPSSFFFDSQIAEIFFVTFFYVFFQEDVLICLEIRSVYRYHFLFSWLDVEALTPERKFPLVKNHDEVKVCTYLSQWVSMGG